MYERLNFERKKHHDPKICSRPMFENFDRSTCLWLTIDSLDSSTRSWLGSCFFIRSCTRHNFTSSTEAVRVRCNHSDRSAQPHSKLLPPQLLELALRSHCLLSDAVTPLEFDLIVRNSRMQFFLWRYWRSFPTQTSLWVFVFVAKPFQLVFWLLLFSFRTLPVYLWCCPLGSSRSSYAFVFEPAFFCCLRWWHKPNVLKRYGIKIFQRYCNQVTFWVISWPWINWVIMSSTFTQDEGHLCWKALHNECRRQLSADRVRRFKSLEQIVCETSGPVNEKCQNARRRSSRLARLRSLSGYASGEHAKNQVQRDVRRASRVLQGNRTENWRRKFQLIFQISLGI